MSYRLTPQAQRERKAIVEYGIAAWSLRDAEKLDAFMESVFSRIGGWSPPGSIREEFADKKFMWVGLAPYPYHVVWTQGADLGDRIIVRILHSRMDFVVQMKKTETWI